MKAFTPCPLTCGWYKKLTYVGQKTICGLSKDDASVFLFGCFQLNPFEADPPDCMVAWKQ